MNLFDIAKTIKPDDVLLITNRMKRGDEVFSLRVSSVITELSKRANEMHVCITYVPCSRKDSVQCGFGCHYVRETPTEWGWQSIEIVGTERPRPQLRAPNLFRNPGYDLVNM